MMKLTDLSLRHHIDVVRLNLGKRFLWLLTFLESSCKLVAMEQPCAPKTQGEAGSPSKRKGARVMIHCIPVHSENILEEAGISNITPFTIRDMLMEHLGWFRPCFWRKGQFEHFILAIIGLLSDLARKNIDNICQNYSNPKNKGNLYHFMREAKFDEAEMWRTYRLSLASFLSHSCAMITGDGCDIIKEGLCSVGAAHQFCGPLGKRAICQAGVMVGYASMFGHGLIAPALYLKKEMFEDDYPYMKKWHVPEDLTFMTKNEILLAMINEAYASGMFGAKYVGVDSSFGSDHKFLSSLPKELVYFAHVKSDKLVFQSQPTLVIPEGTGTGRGRPLSKPKPSFGPVEVSSFIGNEDIPWNNVVLGNGTKGAIYGRDKCARVVNSHGGMPTDGVWLYIREHTKTNGSIEYKYAICNESEDASLEDVRKPALMRWSIEQCFHEGKSYLGMDHHQTRTWNGWNRHMLMTFICHLFVNKVSRKFSTNKDYPLETPFATGPLSIEEFAKETIKHRNKLPVDHKNLEVTAVGPTPILTIGAALKLINMFLVKTGDVHAAIDDQVKANAAAFTSHSRTTANKIIMANEQFQKAAKKVA
jgi:SRSO17 transposase